MLSASDAPVIDPRSEDLVGHIMKSVIEFRDETVSVFQAAQNQEAGPGLALGNKMEQQWALDETAKYLKSEPLSRISPRRPLSSPYFSVPSLLLLLLLASFFRLSPSPPASFPS